MDKIKITGSVPRQLKAEILTSLAQGEIGHEKAKRMLKGKGYEIDVSDLPESHIIDFLGRVQSGSITAENINELPREILTTIVQITRRLQRAGMPLYNAGE